MALIQFVDDSAPYLSANNLNNNFNYLDEKITDIYSTSETLTNKVWIDGKPIYRKVIEKTITSAVNQTIITIANLGVITNCQSYLDRGTYKNINNWGQDSSDFGTIYVANNNIMYNGSYVGTLYVTLEYTKTTD